MKRIIFSNGQTKELLRTFDSQEFSNLDIKNLLHSVADDMNVRLTDIDFEVVKVKPINQLRDIMRDEKTGKFIGTEHSGRDTGIAARFVDYDEELSNFPAIDDFLGEVVRLKNQLERAERNNNQLRGFKQQHDDLADRHEALIEKTNKDLLEIALKFAEVRDENTELKAEIERLNNKLGTKAAVNELTDFFKK